MGLRATGRVATLAAVSWMAAGAVHAQTDIEINAAAQFNFSTPGARSLGLGGAFLGLADDATAAFTNPAGLTVLTKPEFSAEGRRFGYTHEFVDSGRLAGAPTNRGIDTQSGPVFGEVDDSVLGASFVSFVYPKGRWAVAAYRHELANFEAAIGTRGAYINDVRFFPTRSTMELEIVNYGFSGAYKVSDAFSLGAGVSLYDFKLNSLTERYGFGAQGQNFFQEVTDFSEANLVNAQAQVGDDSAIGFNAGFVWRPNAKWQMGAVFQSGPSFEFGASNVGADGTVFFAGTAPFNVPRTFGLGVVYRPSDSTTVAVDYRRVQYSRLTEDFVLVLVGAPPLDPADFTVDDADEIHAGIEYVFAGMANPLAVRVGAWLDPEHKVRYSGTNPNGFLFQPGDDAFHVSGGLGMVFGSNFQLDGAVDFSAPVTTVSFSAVARF